MWSLLLAPLGRPAGGRPDQTLAAREVVTRANIEKKALDIMRVAKTLAHQANTSTILASSTISCAKKPSAVAVIFAMDMRLPSGSGHCSHVDDIACDSKEDILALLNGVTEGSDVFVATDRGFEEEVKSSLQHVAAVRYADVMPPTHQSQIIQWWRLGEAWSLLTDYEQQCGHKYEWVFKMRTDANVIGGGRLADLPAKLSEKLQASELLTFTDRWFGGPRSLMQKVAGLYKLYDEDQTLYERDPSRKSMHFNNVYGTCGGCELLATALHEAHTSPHCTQIPLPDGTEPCKVAEGGCFDTAYGRSFCPLRQEEKDRLWEIAGYDEYLKHTDESKHIGERPWPQPEATGNNYCLLNTMKKKDWSAAPAENMYVLHLLQSGIRPKRWDDTDAGLLDVRHMGLMRWRKMLHLWTDGISLNDGPLLHAEDPEVARIMAEAEMGVAAPEQVLRKYDQYASMHRMPRGSHDDDGAVHPYMRRHNVPFRRGRAQ